MILKVNGKEKECEVRKASVARGPSKSKRRK